MGKPGNKNQSAISNVFRKSGGAYDVSKDRYTDPIVPGVGSPYDQTAWQDFKKGVKKVAGKAKGYVETNYPKVAETLTSIGESSPVINFLTKPRPEMQTGGGFGIISKVLKGNKTAGKGNKTAGPVGFNPNPSKKNN